jgi:HKD family nuclease
VVLQDPAHPKRVLEALAALIADPAAERLRIAVAYASLSGVNALRTLVAAAERKIAVEIVVTLDLGVTRKAALKALLHGPEQAMAIETGDGPGTFHTKLFVVDRVDGTRRALVGSANLTGAALTHNHEAISVGDLSAENGAAWEGWWSDLCSAAEALTPRVGGVICGAATAAGPAGTDRRR